MWAMYSYTCRHINMQRHCTHKHTNLGPYSDITLHQWFLPNLQPPPWEITQSLSSHHGVKYTPLESNRGGGWMDSVFGVVRGQDVVGSNFQHDRSGDEKNGGEGGFSGENAKRIGCVTVPEGVEGVLIQGFGWWEMELNGIEEGLCRH